MARSRSFRSRHVELDVVEVSFAGLPIYLGRLLVSKSSQPCKLMHFLLFCATKGRFSSCPI